MNAEKILTLEEINYLGEDLSLYLPNKEQKRFHSSNKQYRWLFGGNQSGKSFANMMDMVLALLQVHPVRKLPLNALVWCCAESWDMVRDTLWETYLEKFIPASQISSVQYGPSQVPNKVYFKNGNILQFKSFDQGRSKFQSKALDAIYCDEQCLHDFKGIFQELQARLLVKQGYLSWSMTPIVPQIELEERIENIPDSDEDFYLDLNDNRKSRGGYIEDCEIDKLISQWPEEVQSVRIGGKFASFYGSVYKSYSRAVHMIEPFPIPEDWTFYRAIDFGFTNPFCCLFAAKDHDENYFIFDEYYKAQIGIHEHIAQIKRISGKKNYSATFADPENASDRNELRKSGIPTIAAQKDIALGIEAVQSKLKLKQNGWPSLFIFSNCKNLLKEFTVYRYPTATNTKNASDHPLDKDNHALDCLRYLIFSLEKPKKKGKVTVLKSNR